MYLNYTRRKIPANVSWARHRRRPSNSYERSCIYWPVREMRTRGGSSPSLIERARCIRPHCIRGRTLDAAENFGRKKEGDPIDSSLQFSEGSRRQRDATLPCARGLFAPFLAPRYLEIENNAARLNIPPRRSLSMLHT